MKQRADVFYQQASVLDELWLRGLVTARTENWHFLKTVLFNFFDCPTSMRPAMRRPGPADLLRGAAESFRGIEPRGRDALERRPGDLPSVAAV